MDAATAMEDAIRGQVPSQDRPAKHSAGWQMLWFPLHLLAGWTYGTLLPLLQCPTSSSRFEFFFSHILVFSFIPAFLSGLINARLKHKAAEFVWLVPAILLAYKFATYAPPSVLQSQSQTAFHHYFGGGFIIPEFRDFHELFSIAGSNSDMIRGMAQLQFTAPFYAGIGYSVAAWISRRTELGRRLTEKLKRWEESRFQQNS